METILSHFDISKLTSNEKLIYDYFVNNIYSLPRMTLSEICSNIYVSNATVVRFCQKLGFKGYNEFKFALRNSLKDSVDHDSIWKIIPHQISVLKDFRENIKPNDIQLIADYIIKYKPLYIYGRNISSIPAQYLHSVILSLDIPCILIDWIDSLNSLSSSIHEDSLMILFTNYGREDDYVSIIENCYSRNAKIIWISSEDVNDNLKQKIDLFINANETKFIDGDNFSKMTTLLIVQFIIEYLIESKKVKQTE